MSVRSIGGRDGLTMPRVVISPAWRLTLLVAGAVALIGVFMTVEANGNWDFILPFRARKIVAMIVVGFAIAASTVMFQTISSNRILTPSIMGFDSLYMLIQTMAVFTLGSGRLVVVDARLRFLIEVVAMSAFAGVLYWWLFVRSDRGIHLLVLVGIIFGVLFRSVTNLLQRMIDPAEFAVLQDAGFASFNAVDPTLLGLSAGIIAVVGLGLARKNRVLDAMTLGRETAINIGVEYRREVMSVLVMVTILVAVSTALVGPITFFGLLVAHLGYHLVGSSLHRYTIPAAGLVAVIFLVFGQLMLERVFSFNSSLSIMIEFVGGLLFIILLLRGGAK